MTNTSNLNDTNTYSNGNQLTFMGYYCLLMVIIGTIFNILTFFILCQTKFRNTQIRPMIHYMRAIAIIDFLGLYGWTLDTYFETIYGFTLGYSYTIVSCKFSLFFNYVTLQISSWLHVFVSFDRYLFMSRIQPNTWFNRSKNVLIIIISIIIIFFLFNFHFLLFVCYEDINEYIIVNSKLYTVFPLFENIHLCIYNLIPSSLILSFNFISIYYLHKIQRTTTITNSKIRHRPITITLIITSFLFVITRTPSSITYSFFYDTLTATEWGNHLMIIFNLLLYTFPVLNFPIYLLTFTEFRHELIDFVLRRRRRRMVGTVSVGHTLPQHVVQIKLRNISNTHHLR